MLVFRIVLAKYANHLIASGRAARWNANDTEIIYTSLSRSLACLENVVHRSQLGLSNNFCVLTIEIPDSIKVLKIDLGALPKDWTAFENMHFTQAIGNKWVKDANSVVLQVPSSIVPSEHNYLLNPKHEDFKKIKLVALEPFVFDERIKR